MAQHKNFPELDRQIPLFSRLTRRQRALIARGATTIDLPAGYRVVGEGSASRDVYVIVSGSVEVTRGGETVATLGAGDFFGESAALTRTRRNATVTTAEPTSVLHIDGRAIASVISKNTRVAAEVAPLMERRRPSTHDVRAA